MEWLKEMLKGIEGAQELEQKIAEEIKRSYITKQDYNIAVQAKKDLEGQIAQRDADIVELKKSAGNNTEQQYADLQKKYKQDTEALQKRLNESRKHNAVDVAIMQAKGKNTKAIKALIDMDSITLKEDGTLQGLDLERIKKSDGYLFDIEKTRIEGADGSSHYHTADTSHIGTKGSLFDSAVDLFARSARKSAGLSE